MGQSAEGFTWVPGTASAHHVAPTAPSAPIVLIATNDPHDGVISARRDGEPSFRWVQDGWDAVMAAASRGVELHVSASLLARIRSDFPPELPDCIRITEG